MVEAWVKEIVADTLGPSQMKIGEETTHPDGRRVKVVSGVLWADGGYSNWWTWAPVNPDGTLGKEESGYGW